MVCMRSIYDLSACYSLQNLCLGYAIGVLEARIRGSLQFVSHHPSRDPNPICPRTPRVLSRFLD